VELRKVLRLPYRFSLVNRSLADFKLLAARASERLELQRVTKARAGRIWRPHCGKQARLRED
jgi:hypothetical protein